jgi:putative ABC transport system substrate-binding protein
MGGIEIPQCSDLLTDPRQFDMLKGMLARGGRMQSSRMKRRAFITLIGGAAAWPLAVRAQQSAGKLPRIGAMYFLRTELFEAFEQGLREAGYVNGRNVLLEARFSGTALDRIDEVAHELVALECSVILASNPYSIRAATKATSTIPIVGVDLESDPVASGLVKSVARPGGNFTGFFLDIPELGGKQIELLLEAVPRVSRVAVLWDATIGAVQLRATETAPRPAGVTLQSLPIRRVEDISGAFEQATRKQAHGLVVLSSPLIFAQRSHIADAALNARLPTINLFISFPKVGGLMAYGPDLGSLFTQAAGYVARILAGANTADLPIQRPTKFELVINLKTAKAIGLTIPETLLVRADQVIE